MAVITRIMVFLVVAHTLLFYGGVNGYIPSYENDNPHQAFLNNVTGDQLQDTIISQNESSIVTENVGVGYTSLNFVSAIKGILFSPYSLMDNSGLTQMFQTLFKIVLAVLEITALGGFLRGVFA